MTTTVNPEAHGIRCLEVPSSPNPNCFIDFRRGGVYPSLPTRFPGAVWGHTVPRPSSEVTQLLVRWRDGDREALDSLLPLVYDELRRIARHYLQGERPGHTLQSTALVNEAYMRMVAQDFPEFKNRAHFFAVAAQLMRQILVDHARSHRASKRGGNLYKVELTEAEQLPVSTDLDILALDNALKNLADMDPQQCRVVELRFFAGLSIDETAEVLGISPSTVKRDWVTARAWLFRELDRSSESEN
jgi:RNA polymerase sigma factor (TIGR02999 family)